MARAGAGVATTQGVAASYGLLLLTEAGIPVPVPGDLLMLFIGERAAAGRPPLWLAAVALEAVVFVGVMALFVAVRGPGRRLAGRLGARVGFTEDRLRKAAGILERRGRGAIALGRATPGLRTVTVVACASSEIPARAAIPALVLGGTVFVQGHLALGFALGPLARDALERARGGVVIALVAIAALGVALWVLRRGKRAGSQAWTEAGCPACLALGAIASRTRAD